VTERSSHRDDEDRGRRPPSRRAFLQGAFAVSLASYAKLSRAPKVARYARTALGKPQDPDPPFLTCEPIDLCGACACAGDRYRCTCSDGSMTYKTCAAGYDCLAFTLPTCDQSIW
jgi:hypothetical protein